MIAFQYRGKYQFYGIIANLTLHRMSKIEFQPDFLNPQILSFPNMYNTMGSKLDGLALREHFISKIALKTLILVLTILDQLTLVHSRHFCNL